MAQPTCCTGHMVILPSACCTLDMDPCTERLCSGDITAKAACLFVCVKKSNSAEISHHKTSSTGLGGRPGTQAKGFAFLRRQKPTKAVAVHSVTCIIYSGGAEHLDAQSGPVRIKAISGLCIPEHQPPPAQSRTCNQLEACQALCNPMQHRHV